MADILHTWTFRTATLKVVAVATEDYGYRYDGVDENEEVQAKLDSGEYVAFDTTVTVTHIMTDVELARDDLGGSVYPADDVASFFTAHHTSDADSRNCMANAYRVGHYFPAMVAEACDRARVTLRAVQATRTR